MAEHPSDPRDVTAYLNDVQRRLTDVERKLFRLPPGADALQTFEDGSPLGDTRFLNFGAGVGATLVGDGYVEITGSGSRWGTVVVAATDTHSAGKGAADVVCTGTADQTKLDEAVAALQELDIPRGEIVLLEGTYNLTDEWVVSPSGTHVRGMGYGTKISGAGIEITGGSSMVTNLFVSDALAKGIRVTGSYSLVRGCWVENPVGIAIETTGSDTRVEGCVTRNGDDKAIRLTGSESTVINCVIEAAGGIAIEATGGTSIIGNRLYNCEDEGIVSTASGSLIVGNYVEGDFAGDYGIRMTSGPIQCIGNHVERFDSGILMQGSAILTLGNEVTICSKDGIVLNANFGASSCFNNIITSCGGGTTDTYSGILLKDDTNECNVQGNTVRSSDLKYGINISTADCDDNLVTNNDLLNSAVTASFNDAGTGTITVAGNRL